MARVVGNTGLGEKDLGRQPGVFTGLAREIAERLQALLQRGGSVLETEEAEFDHFGQGGRNPGTGIAKNGQGEGVGRFLQRILPTGFILLLELVVSPEGVGGGEF